MLLSQVAHLIDEQTVLDLVSQFEVGEVLDVEFKKYVIQKV